MPDKPTEKSLGEIAFEIYAGNHALWRYLTTGAKQDWQRMAEHLYEMGYKAINLDRLKNQATTRLL